MIGYWILFQHIRRISLLVLLSLVLSKYLPFYSLFYSFAVRRIIRVCECRENETFISFSFLFLLFNPELFYSFFSVCGALRDISFEREKKLSFVFLGIWNLRLGDCSFVYLFKYIISIGLCKIKLLLIHSTKQCIELDGRQIAYDCNYF